MIGIDVLEVSRMKKALKVNTFKQKVFTETEIEYCEKLKNAAAHYTGFFCAKEAVMKALKDCKKITFNHIQILHDVNGAPCVELFGEAKKVFESMGYKNIEISISQTKTIATAICMLR